MSRIKADIHPIITEEVAKALHSKELFTVSNFLNTDSQQLSQITRLTFKEILSVKKFFLNKFSAKSRNGVDYYKDILKNLAIIPTGITNVDQFLQGGFVTGNIYEICGLPASGKTQFALTLTKNIALNMKQNVYYLDTKSDFSAKKIANMLSEHTNKEDIEDCLKRILLKRLTTKHDLINSLYAIKDQLENDLKLRFIIIDSFPALFLDSTTPLENNFYYNHIANIIRYISTEHHICFLITNLIATWCNDAINSINQEEAKEQITCGKYWSTISNTRLKIEKEENENRCILSVLNSDSLENNIQCHMYITNEGMT